MLSNGVLAEGRWAFVGGGKSRGIALMPIPFKFQTLLTWVLNPEVMTII